MSAGALTGLNMSRWSTQSLLSTAAALVILTAHASTTHSSTPSPSNTPVPLVTASASPLVAGNIYSFAGQCGIGGPDYIFGSPATQSTIDTTQVALADRQNNVFILDVLAAAVVEVSAESGILKQILGGSSGGYIIWDYADAVPASIVFLDDPEGMALTTNGDILVSDVTSCAIYKVTRSTGLLRVFAGLVNWPGSYSGDGGPASLARFNGPKGLATDSADNVFVVDYNNNAIRKISSAPGNIVTTIAGGQIPIGSDDDFFYHHVPPSNYYTGDGGPANSTMLGYPPNVAADLQGNVIIPDWMNCIVRKVDSATGIIHTVVGTPMVCGYAGDGGPATLALLNHPAYVSFDSSGNMFIADIDNSVIRRIDANTGIITTIVGIGNSYGYGGDGGPASDAKIYSSWCVSPDAHGNLLLTDSGNSCIRIVYLGAATPASTRSPRPTSSPTHTPSSTSTATHTPSSTSSPTHSPSHTPSRSSSVSRSRSPTRTLPPPPSPSRSATATPTSSRSPASSRSVTASSTRRPPTPSPSARISNSRTATKKPKRV